MDQNKIWDAFQNDEDLLDVGFPARKRFEFLAGKISSGEIALNIGVGKGYLEEILLHKGVDVFCLDPNRTTIELIRERLGLEEEKAQTGYSQSMPFQNVLFDVVIMSEVLEHLENVTIAETLVEVSRVLKPGGRFIGTVPADEHLQANLVVCPHCGERFHRWGHVQSFSKEQLLDLLKQNFKNVRVRRMYYLDSLRLNWKGKISGVLKMVQALFGLKGNNQNFYFEAVRL
ncbi:MAG: hypothetical protein DRJ64_04190 [Thermoprotei archaeon]|nr:MAG: hypothetical protein DRJ64_04190 [Thermoprotei archaeon]